jgi:hypothetical protein
MADGRKDDPIAPRQQDKPEGEREDVEESGVRKDDPIAPLQQDKAEGEREVVEDNLKAQEKKQ